MSFLLPFRSFMVRGEIITGNICFILLITILGWIPAAIWAALSLQNSRTGKRNERLIRTIQENKN
ncbi:YqaE/Pmp3 family membrane protein [Chryseobacterium mulctrae]|uniref:YqaE/Pmp3 family membrane protein n=1 Tax=Chryseobacterium mulctrae TaxID=2576777 RepID=UPI0037423238